MLLAYGNYGLTFSISSSPAGALFLTDPSNLGDGRSGTVTAIKWPPGTQTTTSYVQITVTVTSPLDATPALGIMGLLNVIGLPEGTMCRIGRNQPTWTEQRLVRGIRDELNAWVIPTAAQAGTSFIVRIYNDVNNTASIPAETPFAIGEIFAGRLTYLPTLRRSSPGTSAQDVTGWDTTRGGQGYPLMRKMAESESATLGIFTRKDVYVGGSVMSGGSPNSPIALRRLRSLLATTTVCAICDYTHDGLGPTLLTPDGTPFQQDFIQQSMMLARPVQLGDLSETDSPYFTWPVRFAEAT